MSATALRRSRTEESATAPTLAQTPVISLLGASCRSLLASTIGEYDALMGCWCAWGDGGADFL
eukprot:IDg21852t1